MRAPALDGLQIPVRLLLAYCYWHECTTKLHPYDACNQHPCHCPGWPADPCVTTGLIGTACIPKSRLRTSKAAWYPAPRRTRCA
eukprot:scaffold305972_cov43-Tisochrysis_lutea.AAC.1